MSRKNRYSKRIDANCFFAFFSHHARKHNRPQISDWRAGYTHAPVEENGAGKSTVINILTGVHLLIATSSSTDPHQQRTKEENEGGKPFLMTASFRSQHAPVSPA